MDIGEILWRVREGTMSYHHARAELDKIRRFNLKEMLAAENMLEELRESLEEKPLTAQVSVRQ